LELSLDIGGLPVLVADTAGLRETADEVEKIGIERARNACVLSPLLRYAISIFSQDLYFMSHRVQAADASLLVLACPDAVTSATTTSSGPRLEIPVELAPLVTRHTFILLNKTDLLPTSALAPVALASMLPQHGWAVSLASQAGTDEFLAGLATALQDRYVGGSSSRSFNSTLMMKTRVAPNPEFTM
jgi:tRNA modification GTPase